MPKIIVHQAFLFAVDGNDVIEIETGEQDVSERCAIVAVEQLQVAELVVEGKSKGKAKAPAKPKSKKAAPAGGVDDQATGAGEPEPAPADQATGAGEAAHEQDAGEESRGAE